ncbi:MAG TPA: hypothetical protein VNN18_10790 [Candidatus Xenobia bacterium]|nr:hypothetical protein [Candidatus Xenobia bacterium]
MLRLNETTYTHDPAKLLEAEAGVFEVVSPGGDIFQYVCRTGRSITNQRFVRNDPSLQGGTLWRVTKLGEIRSEQSPAPQVPAAA